MNAEMGALAGLDCGLATPADESRLLTIINTVQPDAPWSLDHLRWQYTEPPAGAANLYVIRTSTVIVSLYAAVPHWLTVDGTAVRAWSVQDVMTLPDYRGRGFLHRLAQRCHDDIVGADEVGYTFPNERSEGSFRRTGWTEIGRVPFRRRSALELEVATAALPSAVTLDPVAGFDGRAAAIWRDAGLRVGIRRDAGYLNWRYRKPEALYHRFMLDGDAGLLVLKRYEGAGHRTVHLCELVVRTAARDLVPAVLDFVRCWARDWQATELTAWLPAEHPYALAIDAFGLQIDPARRRYIFTRAPERVRVRVNDLAAWHLSQGDSDVF